jgi:hypothetical protein
VVINEIPINGTLTMHVQIHMHKGKGGGEGGGRPHMSIQICIFDWEAFGNYLHKHMWYRHNKTCFLFSFGKSFASLGTMQYICATGNLYHGRMAQWSAVQHSSMVRILLSSSPLAHQLFWIGLDWIVLHTKYGINDQGKDQPKCTSKFKTD